MRNGKRRFGSPCGPQVPACPRCLPAPSGRFACSADPVSFINPEFAGQTQHGDTIDAARPRSHRQPVKRRIPHGRCDRASVRIAHRHWPRCQGETPASRVGRAAPTARAGGPPARHSSAREIHSGGCPSPSRPRGAAHICPRPRVGGVEGGVKADELRQAAGLPASASIAARFTRVVQRCKQERLPPAIIARTSAVMRAGAVSRPPCTTRCAATGNPAPQS